MRYTKYINDFASTEEFLNVVRIMIFYKNIKKSISDYDFNLEDLVGVFGVFEDLFDHRKATNEELEVLYDGHT